jgi:hypothetical protein
MFGETVSDYPTLTRMGIRNPHDIVRYSVQAVNNLDILRIIYQRKKGSVLPDSKRFRFTRSEKLTPGGGIQTSQMVSEVSPILNDALMELSQLVKEERSREKRLEIIKDELKRLEEDHRGRIAVIKSLVDTL